MTFSQEPLAVALSDANIRVVPILAFDDSWGEIFVVQRML